MTTRERKDRTAGLSIVVCVEKDEPGFHAFCPKLPGVHTFGMTQDEALLNLKDAIIAYLMSYVKHNEPIPAGLFHVDISKAHQDFCPSGVSIIENLEFAPA